MAVREFDIFSGVNAELIGKLLDYTKDTLPKTVEKFPNQFASAARRMWAATAEHEKTGSPWGKRYASTLVWEPAGKGSARVYVDETHSNIKFVYMMEDGVKPWSIQKALLAGKAAKRSKKTGYTYVIVPFRHRTPGTTKSTSSFASVMPDDVYKMAKEGETVGEKYGHYAGLKRYTEGPHSGYFTFRVASDNPNAKKWSDHPGHDATPVYEKVLTKIDPMIEAGIRGLVERYEKKLKGKFK